MVAGNDIVYSECYFLSQGEGLRRNHDFFDVSDINSGMGLLTATRCLAMINI